MPAVHQLPILHLALQDHASVAAIHQLRTAAADTVKMLQSKAQAIQRANGQCSEPKGLHRLAMIGKKLQRLQFPVVSLVMES